MDQIKSSRRPCRIQVTKLINTINGVLADAEPDNDTLKAQLNVLNRAYGTLQEWDLKMKEQMVRDGVGDDEQDREFDDIMNYDMKYEYTRTLVEKTIEKTEDGSTQSQQDVPISRLAQDKKTYKLPKIQLKKFGGELKEWLGFWSQFEKIHVDRQLHDADKFQYLVQAMTEGSRARDLVCSYPQSADNYPKVVEALKARFGKDELLVEVYVRELLKLVIHNVCQSKDQIDLAKLFDQLESHLRALESLGVSSEKYNAMLYPMVESCLPVNVLRAWQRSSLWKEEVTDKETKLHHMMVFLRGEVEGEQRISLAREGFGMNPAPAETEKSTGKGGKRTVNKEKMQSTDDIPTAMGLLSVGTSIGCVFCGKKHESQNCFTAQSWSLEEKKKKLQEGHRCFICLRSGHRSKSCKLNAKCMICNHKHYAILCPELGNDKQSHATKADQPGEEEKIGESSLSTSNQTCSNDVVLHTLSVRIRGNEKTKIVRVLVDTGSQHSYILKKLALDLGYKPTGKATFSHALFGGTSTEQQHHAKYLAHLEHLSGSFKCNFDVYDQVRICGGIPRPSNPEWIKELKMKNVVIHDFGSGAPEIEVLIGADIFGKLLTGNIIQLTGGLTAIETKLGWSIMGRAPVTSSANANVNMTVTSMLCQPALSDLWELEKIGIRDPGEKLSKEELDEQAREHFRRTVSRDEDGRYQVSLPWIDGHPPLPSNKVVAEKRLQSATRKLNVENMYDEYNSIFNEWQNMEIVERVPNDELGKACHYLPHRPVFKPESLTTKVRPVFDASCQGVVTSGMLPEPILPLSQARVSLNQCLAKGPNLLEMIPDLLLRFREKPVGAIADIRKAFLMINVKPEDRDFLRFLWWDNSACQRTIVMRHRRVVFGVNCSPYLLGAVIDFHLNALPPELEKTAVKLSQSLYVDNVVASFGQKEEYEEFRNTSISILEDAKFDLRLWESNLDAPDELKISNVLGLKWNRTTDTLFCEPSFYFLDDKPITKRIMLSSVAKIFDPVGFLSPVTLIPKILLQRTWSTKLSWDEEVDEETQKSFQKWAMQLELLPLVRVPRYTFCDGEFTLHVFCDASTTGYAAVVYVRSETTDGIQVHLLMAKSRVVPIKELTVNRLELIACEIGARMGHTVKKALDCEDKPMTYWSDSSTVLAWIHRNDEWNTFVGNRVKKILSMSTAQDWRHVPGSQNPADLPSRGCDARFLLESKWWEGPQWLRSDPSTWPSNKYEESEADVLCEKKKLAITMTVLSPETEWYSPEKCHISKYTSLVRVMAYVCRFVEKCQKKTFAHGQLSVDELEQGEKCLLRMVQKEAFQDTKNFNLAVKKAEDDLLRVHTKIIMREDAESFRAPILLPSNHSVVDSLVREEHLQNCHAGVQFLMSRLREKVWILRGRKTIERIVTKCVRCRRFRAKHPEPEAAPLPENRIRDAMPFEVIGIDYAGPLFLKDGSKAWIALYTCAVYRGVHLELVSSLSTDVFLLSLRRFISRHGRPSVIYTDNGTNFVGAQGLLRKLNWNKIGAETSIHRIKWIFNPPASPWWGGWWERLVRSVKELLVRVLGKSVLNFEEMCTVLCDVEAVVNGRPLTYVYENDDIVPLTPAMFIHGGRSSGVPDLDAVKAGDLQRRHRLRLRMMSDLRSRFRKEYLGLLVQKGKKKTGSTLKVGDVALIGIENKKRLLWPIGKINEIIAGRDGIARVAKIRTSHGMLTRPLQRLYPLEVNEVDAEIQEKTASNESESVVEPDSSLRSRYGRLIKKPDRL
ncbi:unnamed protein product [Orchesella dallaii]|uniref:Integrase catalytic domain-containing protein n=1 Tax=Orchesella dallaii TaxID=48710 RepID=A0ABP1QSH3_9HEXA